MDKEYTATFQALSDQAGTDFAELPDIVQFWLASELANHNKWALSYACSVAHDLHTKFVKSGDCNVNQI